jgi:hypothetical protein
MLETELCMYTLIWMGRQGQSSIPLSMGPYKVNIKAYDMPGSPTCMSSAFFDLLAPIVSQTITSLCR